MTLKTGGAVTPPRRNDILKKEKENLSKVLQINQKYIIIIVYNEFAVDKLFGFKVIIMNLRRKYTVFVILLLTVPCIAMLVFSGLFLIDVYENIRYEQLNKCTTIIANELNNYFVQIAQNGQRLSSNEELKEYLLSGFTDVDITVDTQYYLENFVDTTDDIIHVSLYDKAGKLMPVSTNYVDADYLKVTVDTINNDVEKNYGFSNLNKYKLTQQSSDVFTYVNKIYSGDEVIGYVIQYYGLGKFEEIIKNFDGISAEEIAIIDSDGSLIREPFNKVEKYMSLALYNSAADKIERTIGGNELDNAEYSYDYEKYIMTASTVKSTQNASGASWAVVTITSEASLFGNIKTFIRTYCSVVFVIMAVVGAVGVVVVAVLTKRGQDAVNAIVDFRNGNKEARCNVPDYDHGSFCGVVNYILDNNAESEERYRAIVELTDNIVFEYNIAKDVVLFSDNFNSKFSFRAKSLRFEDSFFENATVNRKDKLEFERFVERMIENDKAQGEFSFRTIYNDYAWYIVRSVAIKNLDGKIVKIIGTMIDIDRAKRREENLLKKANFDSLTNIFNRETFEISLVNEYDLSQMRKSKVAVLFIDLDDFKYYNNNFGHALGDEVLVFVADTLKSVVGSYGFPGRYGGDEFVVYYGETSGSPGAGEIAENIIEVLAKGFDAKSVDRHFEIKCSIGISYFDDMSVTAESVIKDADEAMYTVKKNGKSNYCFFNKLSRNTK